MIFLVWHQEKCLSMLYSNSRSTGQLDKAQIPRDRPAAARAGAVGLPWCAQPIPDMHERLVGGLLSETHFSARGSPLGMRVCTRVRVLYMINYRVHIHEITQ